MSIIEPLRGRRSVVVLATGAFSAMASEAHAYMGPGAGGGSLPGVGAVSVIVGLLLIAIGICLFSAVAAAFYAAGRKIVGKLRRGGLPALSNSAKNGSSASEPHV